MDTIAAQATAMVAQPIGIVRLSGPKALSVACSIAKLERLIPNHAQFSKLYDHDRVIDHGVLIYFKAPHSFTGEDVVEMQVHGSVYILSELIAKSLELGCRMAEPGEFSKRAFLNGKMSLDQVEAVSDLIASGSQRAAKSAALAMDGAMKGEVAEIQTQLMDFRVKIEAAIDFSEEEIPVISEAEIEKSLRNINTALLALLEKSTQGLKLQQGIKIALVGEPNAGKSTLMNAICQKDVSIVTSEAGTTRDVVGKDIHYQGVCFHFLDTAGIRETKSIAEKEGINRSYLAMQEADLVLYIKDVRAPAMDLAHGDTPIWVVDNKVDLAKSDGQYAISAKNGEGVDALLQAILRFFQLNDQGETVFSARERHIDVLKRTKAAIPQKIPLDVMAAALFNAQQILSEITGEVTVDDLLGQLFSDFCIGK